MTAISTAPMAIQAKAKLTASLPFSPEPLSQVLGAEVKGFDVRTLTDAHTETIKDYLRDCQLLVFRDQDLAPQDMVRFAGLFGEPQRHILKQFRLPEAPEIYVLTNKKDDEGKAMGNAYEGLGWHTDLMSPGLITSHTALYGLEVPSEGGHTGFVSMYGAYESLPPERRAYLETLTSLYSYGYLYRKRLKMLAAKGIDDHPYDVPLTEAQEAFAAEKVPMPVCDTNPYNGRKWLHFSSTGCAGVVGMPEEEGIKLIDDLSAYATSTQFRYLHQWRKNDLLIWDNRGLFHSATDYDRKKHTRHIWRCLIGEAGNLD